MCLSIFACIFPPIAVCWRKGCCSPSFCLSVLLTLFGWIPGVCWACYVINQEEKGGVTQVTTIHMAAPVTSPPQHVVVNVNERQGPSGSGGPYGHSYPMPTPVGGPHSPPYPMTSHNLYPTPIQSPPPAYNYASAPQYSGEGDYIPPK